MAYFILPILLHGKSYAKPGLDAIFFFLWVFCSLSFYPLSLLKLVAFFVSSSFSLFSLSLKKKKKKKKKIRDDEYEKSAYVTEEKVLNLTRLFSGKFLSTQSERRESKRKRREFPRATEIIWRYTNSLSRLRLLFVLVFVVRSVALCGSIVPLVIVKGNSHALVFWCSFLVEPRPRIFPAKTANNTRRRSRALLGHQLI